MPKTEKQPAPTMLYRAPGPHAIHGGHFDFVIVDESEVSDKLAEGWHLTTTEAAKAAGRESASMAALVGAAESAVPGGRGRAK